HLEIRSAGQQPAQIAEQEVDVEAALVGFVEDERVVAQEPAVALDLGEQDAVGHQLDQRAVADSVGESHGVADCVAERAVQLVSDALRDCAGGQSPGLGVPDRAAHTTADVETDLGQLGGFARAGFSGDDDHLVIEDRRTDFLAPLADRQVGVLDCGDGGLPAADQGFGGGNLIGELLQLLGPRATQILQAFAKACGVTNSQPVKAAAQLGRRCWRSCVEGRLGHSGQDRRLARGVLGAGLRWSDGS
ncbi:MAG: hypothetical protein QOF15_492, partial [Mycobacterium sp.]|nr:hypothetical protein [Mycobacterium sp.]